MGKKAFKFRNSVLYSLLLILNAMVVLERCCGKLIVESW